jgi:hypothetical protein
MNATAYLNSMHVPTDKPTEKQALVAPGNRIGFMILGMHRYVALSISLSLSLTIQLLQKRHEFAVWFDGEGTRLQDWRATSWPSF